MSFMKKTLVLALLAASFTAVAGSTSFTPLGFTLPQTQSIDSMTLTNTGESAVRFQAQAFSWTQVDGRDVLTPNKRCASFVLSRKMVRRPSTKLS